MEPQAAPAHYPQQVPQPKGGRKYGCLAVLGCLLFGSMFVNMALMAFLGASKGEKRSASKLKEIHVSGKGKNKIAVLRVRGAIMDGDRNYAQQTSATVFNAMLERAIKDKSVKGILIKANSPGGGVTASDKIYNTLLAVRKSKKPVVMIMEDLCASGCVYMSAAVDKIFAHPTTVTGSIGVIISTINFHKFMEKHGIQGVAITSKENKALLSPMAPIKEEHKQILKVIVDDMYKRFVSLLSKGRKIPIETLTTFADGRVFTAAQAKKYKLIDEIGYYADAKREILKMTKLSNAHFVSYRREVGIWEMFRSYSSIPKSLESSKHLSIGRFLNAEAPRAYYLWNPPSH